MNKAGENYEPAISERFGERLRRLRKARNWSQTKLAERAGTKQSYVADLEIGRVINPSNKMISGLATALNISIEELTGQVGSSIPHHIHSFSYWLATKNITEHQLTFIQRVTEIYLEEQQTTEQPKVS